MAPPSGARPLSRRRLRRRRLPGDGVSSTAPVDPPLLAVRRAVGQALAEDVLPLGDLTASLVPATTRARARIVSRRPGVVAGRLCVVEAFAQVDSSVTVDWELDDG